MSNTGDCTTAFPCALGVVPAGATRTITATFTVPITYPGLGPIVNVASVSATTLDDAPANNTATVETPLNRNADVAITKSVSPASVLVGQPTTFTVVVTNHGPARVTGLVVQDLLPAGLSFVSASPSLGSYDDATGRWTIGTLLNAQSATLTLEATVTVAGAITNRALVVGAGPARPGGEQQLGGGDRERRRQRRRRRDQDRRPAGAAGGRNRDVHRDGDQPRARARRPGSSSRTRCPQA